jgi:hypothetical protein
MITFPFSRTFGAGTHELATTDLNVLVDTSQGAVNLILPSISDTMDFVLKQGYSSGAVGIFPMNITDISNNASVNNITITTKGIDKFSGNLPSVVISENSGSYFFKPASTIIWSISKSGVFNNTPPTPSNVDCFTKVITGNFATNDVQNTFNECYLYLDNGTYIFDIDYNYATIGLVGNSFSDIRTNIASDDINVMPEDIVVSSRTSYTLGLQVGSLISVHLMTGKVILDAGEGNSPVFKVAFADTLDADMQISNIFMRAIKIA